MSSRMIGVEIGSSTIKMTVCSGGLVKKAAVKRMPEDLVRDGRATAASAMSEFLREMRKEFGIPAGDCAFVLPSQIVISHHVSMPVMGDAELRLNLPFEFRDFVGKDGAKYDYDYSVMSVNEGVMNLFACAVRQDVVEEYFDILKRAGLKMKVAVPLEMALSNLVNATPNLPSSLCIVDIGHNFTRIAIFKDGNYIMGKDIELGGSLIDQTIATNQKVDPYVARTRKESNMNKILTDEACMESYQTIAFEITKVLNFYSYSSEDNGSSLQDMYFCGSSSVVEPLRTALVKATDMTLHHISRIIPGSVENDETLSCVLAAGASIQKAK